MMNSVLTGGGEGGGGEGGGDGGGGEGGGGGGAEGGTMTRVHWCVTPPPPEKRKLRP